MRPEILNPLFAEVEVLKGIGPALAKPHKRPVLERVVDILLRLPTGWIERKRVDLLDMADAGGVVTVLVTPVDYRQGGPRGPFRALAADRAGNYLTLTFFNKPGWAKKQLPLGAPKIVSGRMEMYGQDLQIVHPDYILEPKDALDLPEREPVYALSEGLTNRRMGDLAGQALARVPSLGEWIEPSLRDQRGWPGWEEALHGAHKSRNTAAARERLAYDEVFANQLALMLVRASARRRKGVPLQGDGRLRRQLRLPYKPTGAQSCAMAEIEGDMAQPRPMLRLLQGDVGAGKTLVALEALLIAVGAGAQGPILAPPETLPRQHFETLTRQLPGLPV